MRPGPLTTPSPRAAECHGSATPRPDRRVTAYYFYLVDEVFGPAFVKVCAYFPGM